MATEREMKRRCENPVTMLRRAFPPDEDVAIPTSHFRYLYKNRGLRGFRIRMVVCMQHRKYLSKWVGDMLQKRWDEQLAGRGKECRSILLKLELNSAYGFAMKENFRQVHVLNSSSLSMTYMHRYKKLVIITESTLKRELKYRKSEGRNADDLLERTIIGTCPTATGGRELLFIVSRSNEKARLNNVIGMSAAVLGHSRRIFYSILEFSLNHFKK